METVTREFPGESARSLERQGLPPLAARVFAARGVSDRRQIGAPLDDLLEPGFADIGTLASLVARAIADGDPICVVGDADADGFTATALVVATLRELGGTVRHRIPPRTSQEHGIVPSIVEEETDAGARLILTVDNGVDAFEAAERAKRLGVRLCVTDHHLPRRGLPGASCVVNPHRDDCPFPSKTLSGVGVAFYVAGAIRRQVTGDAAPPAEALDLVAIGTVADRCPLDLNNRILVANGMRLINTGECRPGVRALFRQAGRRLGTATTQDIAHGIAPLLNSAGRLDRCDTAMACLLAQGDAEADGHAATLGRINQERQAQDRKIASGIGRRDLSGLPAIVLFDPAWPPGFSGPIASHLVREHRVPAFALCPGDPGLVRGSGRAPDQVNLHAMAREIEREAPGLLLQWGGHGYAIGLAMEAARVGEFARVAQAAAQRLAPAGHAPDTVATDGSPAPDEITPEAAHWLCTAVWGNGFERPRFVGEFTKLDERAGAGRRRLSVRMGDRTFAGLSFSSARLGDTFRALFRIVPGDTRAGQPRLVLEDPL